MSRVDKLVARARRIVQGHNEAAAIREAEIRRKLIERLEQAQRGELESGTPALEAAADREALGEAVDRLRKTTTAEERDNGTDEH